MRPLTRLRDTAIRGRVRDAVASELLGDPRSLWTVICINAVAFLVGIRYYVATMPEVPTLLWPLYADSPTAVALGILVLVTLVPVVGSGRSLEDVPVNRSLAYLQTLAFVWLVKYGLWPLISLNIQPAVYLGSPDALLYYWGVLISHLLFVGFALLIPAFGRTTRGALALALGLSFLNDLLDYGFGYHPPLNYEPGVVLPVLTVALSVFSVWFAARSFDRLDADA